MAGAPDPKRLPAIVLKKINDIVRRHTEIHPTDTGTFLVTATLRIDATTGKIVDLYATSSWEKQPDGSFAARYGVINHRNYQGTLPYGMLESPEVHTENK